MRTQRAGTVSEGAVVGPGPESAQRRPQSHAADRWTLRTTGLVIVLFCVVLAVVAFGRGYFNYDTETDYVGSFVHEAGRLLRGETLEMNFHPPLYAFTLAGTYTLVRDWYATGLVVSLAAALASLTIALVLLRRLLGVAAAVAGVLALMVSPTFVHYSMQATSDVFALALHLAAILAVYLSVERRRPPYYLVAGLVIGVGLLARTNHVAFLGLLLFYLIPRPDEDRRRVPRAHLRGLGAVAAGIGAPLLAWSAFAVGTGAPLLPTKNHENLALTYFAEGSRISGDSRRPLAERFTSTREVLLADPARIARIYLTDLRNTTFRLLARDTVLPAPLIALALVGWLAIMVREREKRLLLIVLVLNLAAMYLLLNFKAYEHRYYLYLVPFVGAAIGYGVHAALRSRRTLLRVAALALAGLVGGYAVVSAASEVPRLHTSDWSDDAHAAAAHVRASAPPPGSIVSARKSHLGYYAGLPTETMPDADDAAALAEAIERSRVAQGDVFVFYGSVERRTRPQYGALAEPDEARTIGLELVARGTEAGGWFLYVVRADVRSLDGVRE